MGWSSRPRLLVAVAAMYILLVLVTAVAAEAVDFDVRDSGRGEGPRYSKKTLLRHQGCTYDRSFCNKWGQPGPDCCAGKCVDLKTNVHNCGKCGVVCGWGLSCCNSNCVDLENDSKHCGGCGSVCYVSKFGKKSGQLGKCQFGLCGY